MIEIILCSFIFSLFIPLFHRIFKRYTGLVVSIFSSVLFIYFLGYIDPVYKGGVYSSFVEWVPGMKINFSFLLDGLSLLFSLLITGVGALVFAYSFSYFGENKKTPNFYFHMMIFFSSMLGLVLSDNLITMFVFWELTSISSYMLIGFYHEKEKARSAALKALLVTGGGGLAMLAGILFVGEISGTYEFTELLTQNDIIKSHPLYLTVLILFLLGAFTKSAQFPFHFWLPSAMEAPTPVSAYLHSATMVTAGVYLLARLSPLLGETAEWHYIVTSTGSITMILGAFYSFRSSDLKSILAYSTVSALGVMMLLLGLDTSLSVKAAMVFLVVHSLYKGALFLVAGSVDHETGTRDIKSLSGLFRSMPVTAVAGCLAALSMAGLPPLFGFIAKELVYEAKIQTPDIGFLITIAGVTSNIIVVAVAGILSLQIFFGKSTTTPKLPKEPPPAMLLGPVVLAFAGLLIGMFPGTLAKPIVSAAVSAVRAEPTTIKLMLWHGINPVLLLGILTAALGAVIYVFRERTKRILSLLSVSINLDNLYESGLKGLNTLARSQTKLIQSGYLSNYILIVILTTIVFTGGLYFFNSGPFPDIPGIELRPYELLVALMILAGAAITVSVSSRLTAIVGLGVIGYGMTIIFIFFGAPDLAITQFAIETLTVVLFVLAIYRLPRFRNLSGGVVKLRDCIVAISFGGLITLLLLNVISFPVSSQLKEYFGDSSLSLGKGLNVVNVILVDFRALDTLGETIVLAAAAMGIYALLKLRMEK